MASLPTPEAARAPLPAPGAILGGKYAIVRILGEGGMGVVYEATHVRLRQRVAVKMLLDFGLSKVEGEVDSKLTGTESVVGTALYMSPEQVRSSANVDARTDIWALGVILYELVSGQPPWMGTLTQVAAAIVTDDPPD